MILHNGNNGKLLQKINMYHQYQNQRSYEHIKWSCS